jgi:hypothetical protein
MKKLMAVLIAVLFFGSTGLLMADGTPTGKRIHKPAVAKHHKKGKKGNPPPAGGAGMENRINN